MSKTDPRPGFVPVEALTARTRYWRSLEERAGLPLPEDPDGDPNETLPPESRRRFVALMAASLGLGGLTACTRQPTELVAPYTTPPEQVIPGVPEYYATAVPAGSDTLGVLVESHLGRPTKVEGNPDHPASLGATDVTAQASVLDLYDPDRARDITRRGVAQSWEQFLLALEEALGPVRALRGRGLHILTRTVVSPTMGSQLQAVFREFPGAQWHQWEPAGPHSARSGSHLAFGQPVNTYYLFQNASVVLSLDSDFLMCGLGNTRYAHDFAVRRRKDNRLDMNRLYVVESGLTSTGGKADHRLAVTYGKVEAFARELAAALKLPGAPAPANPQFGTWVAEVADDLRANAGASIVIAGDQQPPEVHAIAHGINLALGNAGKTVIYTDPIEVHPVDQLQSLQDLAQALTGGEVQALLIFGANPVYDAPAELDFARRIPLAPFSALISLFHDETAQVCHWHLPESHFLEDWGDVRAFDGTASIIQPLIQPLYGSASPLRVLDAFLQRPGRTAYDIVRQHWSARYNGPDFESWWRKALRAGVIPDTQAQRIQPKLRDDWFPPEREAVAKTPADAMEVVFRPDPYIHDGRYANNAWLQELPRPMTKLTWDNAVLLNPASAKRLRVTTNDVVRLAHGNRSVEGAVWLLPGQPDQTITVHLGWGHGAYGRAANGAGFNAYLLRTSDSLWHIPGIEVHKTGATYPLATTQMQQYMLGRPDVLSAPVSGYRRNPNLVQERIERPEQNDSLYPRWEYPAYAWGMAIDLTACVNCSACVVACQAENNIPVVGKGQVLARRAMHWLRVDTYFEGGEDHPSAVYYQPVPCMQCENAPCELVCPVHATTHSDDGLNDMTYNRCVGTRYCSNNCPYKVRRFNFFLYADWYTESLKLQRNPDVTVRSRGVMEKCTYCVQRIREAQIRSEVEDRLIRDGEIQTACQQACPTRAIVFGNINDRNSAVSRLKAEPLNYSLLAELNSRPRTTYLAELRNPNPKLGGSAT
jgi:Fe-S-cluster-containing dehydrogenase component/anaerobic selenocysteine-containing dehydrogenase